MIAMIAMAHKAFELKSSFIVCSMSGMDNFFFLQG